jgi:hypothetical protein
MLKIPGLSFSWRRAIGLSAFKGRVARYTGIPTTRTGRQRKVGRLMLSLFGLGGRRRSRW